MRARFGTTALVAGIMAGIVGMTSTAGAQETKPKVDSAPHFSLFGGSSAAESNGPETGFELGGSGDFRWKPIPVPLRLSLSFSQRHEDNALSQLRGGKASLEAVMRPMPKFLGIRPYFLGGLGVATRAGYSAIAGGYYVDPTVPPAPYYLYTRQRQTWAFASAGLGLDIGRAFIQMKFEAPIASNGPVVVPISVGFRFWD